ncbi:hypothetical protein BT93_H0293 [Corymbia citriodora subsp. variegata]|nr:hypothetical protein BT93_H0293 [Corymbia citriodora subsp. variegata]
MSCFGNCLSSCRKKCPRGRQEGEGMQQPIAIGSHAHPFRYHERKRRGSTYECNACQQPGCRPYYSCTGGNGCNFHYHKRCSDILRRESPPVSNHPPYPIGRYIFDERAPGNVRYCVACGDPVLGLRYKVCRYPLQNNRAFHPLCAVLPPRIQEPREQQIVLELKERIRGECPICQGSARGWAYNSTCGTYCYCWRL